MRRTKEKAKQDILEAMLSGSQVIKTSEIMKAKGLARETVERYKDKVYREFIGQDKLLIEGLKILLNIKEKL